MGRPVKDMLGERHGMLLVKARVATIRRHAVWLCECDCGAEIKVRADALRKGQMSCGHDNPRGQTHGMCGSRVYAAWTAMVQRCTNPNVKRYPNYGGRGIVVCDHWRKFENFHADMGDPPAGYSLERRDNDGNYEKANCIWLPLGKQSQNRRGNIYIDVAGETVCLAEASRRLGIDYHNLAYQVKNGWPMDRILQRRAA